jgi:hypothetical protein
LQDVAAAYDLTPSGTACLEHAADPAGLLHGVSTPSGGDQSALIHQVGCTVLPYARRDEVSLLSSSSSTEAVVTTAQCCQVARLDLHVLPPRQLQPSSDVVWQRNLRAYLQYRLNEYHNLHTTQSTTTDTTTTPMMIRTLAIPDPLLTTGRQRPPTQPSTTSSGGSANVSSSDKDGSSRLTILAGTLTAVLVVLSLLIVGYRRRRRRHMFHHTRMIDHQYDHPYEWSVHDKKKKNAPMVDDEEIASTTLDPDSSDYSSMSNSWTNGIGSTNHHHTTVTVPVTNRSAAASVPAAAVLRAAVVGNTTKTTTRPPTSSDGLYRPAVTTTTAAPPSPIARSLPVPSSSNQKHPQQQQQPSHHYPCRAMGPAAACLGDLSSMREHMFWPTRTCIGGGGAYGTNGNGGRVAVGCPTAPWDVDDISEADSWAQTDATVGSLEDRLESITAEI